MTYRRPVKYTGYGPGQRRVPALVRYQPARGAATARNRMFIARRQRGYVRTGGYFGRFQSAGELKFKDTSLTLSPVLVTSSINDIVAVGEGVGESQRIGRKMTIKKINCRGEVKLNNTGAGATQTNAVRICIVQDTQTNGAVFTGLNLWEADNIESFRNLANTNRFKILKTKEITINTQGGTTLASEDYAATTRRFNFNVACNVPIEYDNSASTGVITSCRSNNVYFLIQAKGATWVDLTGNARIRFTDK